MKIERIKTTNNVKIEMNIDEAEHLMHIIWFGLDYEAENHKMNEAENVLAHKMLEIFKIIVMNDEEWEI